MQISETSIKLPFAYAISTPQTNFNRQKDSRKESPDNLKNVQAFVESGGWSPQFPMICVSMHHWPLAEKISAVAYVAGEMTRRKAVWDELEKECIKADTTGDAKAQAIANREMKVFEDVFCSDGKLIELTVDNAYWVHSGHQRTQFVFLAAYYEYLRLFDDGEEKLKPFRLTVPACTATYDDFMDILEDQVSANSTTNIQNKLGVLDYAWTAVQAIGTGMTPAINESRFRRWGADASGKPNSGAYPRLGYKFALLNFYFKQRPGFYKALTENPKLPKMEGEKEALDNPNYINWKDLSVDAKDPRYNVAVISRLRDLDLLRAYDRTEGSGNEEVKKGTRKSSLSAMEEEVLRRSIEAGKDLPYTEEEFVAWMDSIKHGSGYKPPVAEKPKPVFKTDKVADLKKSESAPQFIKDFADEFIMGEQTGANHKLGQRSEAFDFVYQLDPTNDSDLAVLEALTTLATFREGNPEGYSAFVTDFRKVCDQHLPKASGTTEASGTTDTTGTTEASGTPEVSTDATGTPEVSTDSATAESTVSVDETTEHAPKPARGRRSGK